MADVVGFDSQAARKHYLPIGPHATKITDSNGREIICIVSCGCWYCRIVFTPFPGTKFYFGPGNRCKNNPAVPTPTAYCSKMWTLHAFTSQKYFYFDHLQLPNSFPNSHDPFF